MTMRFQITITPACPRSRCSAAHATPQVWTSLKDLDGREFCSMLNALIRDDAQLTDEVADQVPTRDEPR